MRLTSRERWFFLLVSPWIVGFVVLQMLPMLASAALAFSDWRSPAPAQWVGLDNFSRLISDQRFLHALYNTAVYAFWTVVPGLVLRLVIAFIQRGSSLLAAGLRSAVFMPAMVAGVATALMWGWIFNPRSGLLNGVLGMFGIRGPDWLHDPAWAMVALVGMGLWGVGINVVVYVAALRGVPRDLEDSAALDGAGLATRFRHVIWPALTPVTFYLVVVNTIVAFQVFTPNYLLTDGGPQDATLTTALYTYQVAFGAGEMGYASAATLVVVALVLGVAVFQFRYLGRRVLYGGTEP